MERSSSLNVQKGKEGCPPIPPPPTPLSLVPLELRELLGKVCLPLVALFSLLVVQMLQSTSRITHALMPTPSSSVEKPITKKNVDRVEEPKRISEQENRKEGACMLEKQRGKKQVGNIVLKILRNDVGVASHYRKVVKNY